MQETIKKRLYNSLMPQLKTVITKDSSLPITLTIKQKRSIGHKRKHLNNFIDKYQKAILSCFILFIFNS